MSCCRSQANATRSFCSAFPFLFFGFGRVAASQPGPGGPRASVPLALLVWSLFFALDYAGLVQRMANRVEIRRDYAASVISAGEGLAKALLVNGVGVTGLVPITKFMAHLPLAFHTGKPESALVICFGMGTTLSFRFELGRGDDGRGTGAERARRFSVLFFRCGECSAETQKDAS